MIGIPFLSSYPILLSQTPHLPPIHNLTPHSNHKFHQTQKLRPPTTNPRTTTICYTRTADDDQLEELFFGGGEEDDQIEWENESEEEDDDDDEETESSLDLLFRFVHSLFKKVSRRAKKATRLVLPHLTAPQLVSFAVDGVLLLASLSIVKAFLEVICTLGSTVFIAILLLRLVWATVSHFQSSDNRFDQSGGNSYTTAQPAN